jgi:hypothetical protein
MMTKRIVERIKNGERASFFVRPENAEAAEAIRRTLPAAMQALLNIRVICDSCGDAMDEQERIDFENEGGQGWPRCHADCAALDDRI